MQTNTKISDTIKVLKQAIEEVGDLRVATFSHRDKQGNVIITKLKDVTRINFDDDDTGKNLQKGALVWFNTESSLASELITDLETLMDEEGDLPIRYFANSLSYLFPRCEYIKTKDKQGINYIVIY